MRVYLMRHGIARERDEWDGADDARPLTSEGRQKVKAVTKALRKQQRLDVSEVWTSPLARARETAEIAAKVLKVPVKDCPALACGADLAKVAAALATAQAPDGVLLVGHEPDCGGILAQLLGEPEPRPFKKAGVACVEGQLTGGGMRLKWHVAPKDVLEG
jgi:phosphohistidine phosphatase